MGKRIPVELTPVQMALIYFHMMGTDNADFNKEENEAILELLKFSKPHVPHGYVLGKGTKDTAR